MARKRTHRDYSERQGTPAQPFEGFRVDEPVAGFYRMRLRSGAVWSAIKIWHGPPHDPDTGEEMDRSWRWQAKANGQYVELERVWPQCAGTAIDAKEYDHLMRTYEWGKKNAPDSPQANPTRRVDLLNAPVTF